MGLHDRLKTGNGAAGTVTTDLSPVSERVLSGSRWCLPARNGVAGLSSGPNCGGAWNRYAGGYSVRTSRVSLRGTSPS